MRSVLLLNAKEAKDFFLKEDSYFNFELPPYFDFSDLLIKISKKIGDKNLSDFYTSKKPKDFDDVNYKLITNKDGKYAWRPLQLIHPALYVHLVCIITQEDSWQYIKDRLNVLIKNSRNIECASMPVVSKYYKKDRAEQIIRWSNEVERQSIINSLEYEYLFHTDITDCYGSIYTHSIPWALHGRDKAKKERMDKKLIGNKIDILLRDMSHGQTNGIPQGSVLMDFVAEIVLCYIDNLLSERIKHFKKADYKIIRYRDDYRIFTNNPQIAEHIIKELTDILNNFGMKINSGKTIGINNVIHSSVKLDKLHWIINKNNPRNLMDELYSIFILSQEFPNSGTLITLLSDFHDKILKLSKKDINENLKVLISIVVDIACKNPRAYPLTSAIISKFVDFLSNREKEQIIKKILIKFKKIPNTGIMQLWLQRITIKLNNNYSYSEKLCNKVLDNSIVIWQSDWLNSELKNIINSYNLINKKVLEELGAVIASKEVKLFELSEYPF